ncbi:methyltransferase domain-containing protein [Niallia sp. JL1B1071]|uniref:methyltransferase domain-containing protein n=1 Tax=Niallia tiangongensis TaxID=3237105 RepID=UPI0037DDB90A
MKKKVILFGASKLGQIAKELLSSQYEVIYFCDNNQSLHQTYIDDIEIISPDQLRSLSFDEIIISSTYHNEISDQLIVMEIYNFQIFNYTVSKNIKAINAKSMKNLSEKEDNDIKEYYDLMSDYVNQYHIMGNQRLDYIKKRLNYLVKPGFGVLDLGCGNGITTDYISKLGATNVIGIDLSDKMIQSAKEKYEKLDFRVGDITEINLGAKFDLITLFDVMEHIPRSKYNNLFKSAKKHLKDNGTIFISIPDPVFLDYLRIKSPEELQIIDNSIEMNELYELCHLNGLEIVMFKQYKIGDSDYNEYTIVNKKEWI